jgi:Spy/CpxP family protein refolding chaperone
MKKLDPSMMKALKLFAKNHQQLEKATDPHRGAHRRVLSSDGRTANNNIAASTFEKCGGQIPVGPKYMN